MTSERMRQLLPSIQPNSSYNLFEVLPPVRPSEHIDKICLVSAT